MPTAAFDCSRPHPALDLALFISRLIEVGLTLAAFLVILAAFMLACGVYVRTVEAGDLPRDRKYRWAKVMAAPMKFWFWMG